MSDGLEELSFENDAEVSVFTTGWLGVPRAEVGRSRAEACLGGERL